MLIETEGLFSKKRILPSEILAEYLWRLKNIVLKEVVFQLPEQMHFCTKSMYLTFEWSPSIKHSATTQIISSVQNPDETEYSPLKFENLSQVENS